ncbi:hypothetical protein SCHPADRAFT_935845 [Schizopora paradoxa]|uniref:DUF6533 domain-containing protein n=1 Tax=Schizopora paradoxa TaxID=27342 RepID=A0A0H2S3Y2_9AGAM|nr:hypothetical protein SCHPADRAFT_935845 [Schizopora paradoxa]
MSGALSQEQINAITQSITLLRASSYVTVAIAACFVCDIIFSFGEEVTLVWPSRWSLTKGLYFYNRYSPFLDVFVVVALFVRHPSPESCYVRNEIMGYLIIIGTTVSEGIIMMRTFALWNRNKLVKWFFLVMIVTIPITNTVITNGPAPSPALLGCFATQQGTLVWISFALFLAMESVVVSLTLYKGIDHVQTVKTRLVYTLYEDGLMYYLFFFVITLANIVLYFAGPPELVNTLALPARVIHSILATHVILRIRACMRDRQLRQAGRPMGSTWLPAQYTGELDESFSISVAQAVSEDREIQHDGGDGAEEVDESRNGPIRSVSSAGICRPSDQSGYIRACEEEDDRGEGSSKLADSITIGEVEERGVHIRKKLSSADLERGNGKNPCSCGIGIGGSGEDDDEVDDDAPFSITSIMFADPPYASDEQPIDFEAQVATDGPRLDKLDTEVNSPGFSSTSTAVDTRYSPSFWSSIRRVLDRRRPPNKSRGSMEALTCLELPSPLPQTSIELKPLPNFA